MKKAYEYRLRLEQTAGLEPGSTLAEPLEFLFTNHDHLFTILTKVEERELLSVSDTQELVIGLKLLTEVVLRNRTHALFTDLQPALLTFTQHLKKQLKQTSQSQHSSTVL